ncbi:type 1 glutamine amidotransferase [Sulfitobacter donghicola]|uniref:Glutamine amidotransferase n=1 Tax=Sulfitobacter donghicola DSW-25 = KCTC 12864 = JCM 14565 TaxID=1300350 RepID=A0A073IKE2_9RHOB|nr:type 1 glutamine amidotransferase [Sulfitobacter donghicola]KEJ89976.1 glutamine amidotransferase [Sulfitobacter donghicola DSW-25 = KCTC 12864 = JCM 14565]KIN66894.1 Glutamine amidotransferase, class I [Sulfitobacter donghicola DSW-25 = KCTC 12864 = JCM 14565]
MEIGILRTGHSPDAMKDEFGNYDALFEKLLGGGGLTFETFSVVDGEFPSGAQDADGWLITGSRHGAYEKHDWIPPLEKLIREIDQSGKPLIGVCFGHQIIAQALGGKVEKFDGGWSVGRTEYMIDDKPVALNAWHQDQVVALPEGARVVGSSDFCANAVLAYGDHIWTLQPHPEFEPAFIEGLINKRGRGVVPDEQLDEAAQALPLPIDNGDIAKQMVAFFKSKENS